MDPIPISFKHNGIDYAYCYFTKVNRADKDSFWLLYDCDNYYLGKLLYNERWVFDAEKRSTRIDELGEYFGDFVEKANRRNVA